MSLHRTLLPPQLALAVHPAPPHQASKDKDKEKEKSKEGRDAGSANDAKEAKEANGKDDKIIDDTHAIDDAAKAAGNKDGTVVKVQDNVVAVDDTPEHPHKAVVADIAPASPSSNVPEPPTPTPGAVPPPTPKLDKIEETEPEAATKVEIGEKTNNDDDDDAATAAPQTAPAPEPLLLLGPAPPRPVRAQLDLHPSKPYPPIYTDPRGAYYRYAKGGQGEWMLIDVVKDGWMAEQWRERSEREALARLRGETDRQRRREEEADMKKRMVRPVPHGAEQILLELWNDLVEAPNNEIHVDAFWARYDWTEPDAHVHLLDVKRPGPTPVTGPPAAPDTAAAAAATTAVNDTEIADGAHLLQPQPETEWTKTGLEEILTAVGVQCAYKMGKLTSRPHWTEPTGAYLILGHGFFMIRSDGWLQWKAEEKANKFEQLVTSGHDRVFGDMVKHQQLEERKKKEAAYRAKKAQIKKQQEEEEAKQRGEASANGEAVANAEPGAEAKAKAETGDETGAKAINPLAAKLLDIAIPPTVAADAEALRTPVDLVEAERMARMLGMGADGEPIKLDDIKLAYRALEIAAEQGLDGGRVSNPKGKDGKCHDAGDDGAEVVEGNKKGEEGKEADNSGQNNEKAGENDDGAKKQAGKEGDADANGKGANGKDVKGDGATTTTTTAAAAPAVKQPLIWTWAERCERWRWNNYEAGLHLVGPGGWEERDWRVFADDRGCAEFEEEMREEEVVEIDVHDWSC